MYKSSSNLDHEPINGLNEYFGELHGFDQNYTKSVPAEIDANIPAPQLSTTQERIKRTATGPDGIPFFGWIWKDHAEVLFLLLNLWNLSLARQSWPSRWKEANIDPLAKIDIPGRIRGL